LTNERRARLESDAAQLAAAINRTFNSWMDENPDWLPGRTSWSAPVSTIQQQLRTRGRGADLIVLASPASAQEFHRREPLQSAIFDAERPVLVVPNKVIETIGRSIAIFWDDQPSTIKAVLDAMPLLDRAEEVFVLITDGDAPKPGLPQLLIDHGIDAVIHPIASGPGARGAALLDYASQLRADLLIMGAYPHPLIELMPGGVTRYVVSHADLPILMRH
jgi:nucleotide-binding universal stress UspA family protein